MLLVLAFVMEAFFFFQAEDGIRDFHVTGVQTCALPIFPCRIGLRAERREQCRENSDRLLCHRPHSGPAVGAPCVTIKEKGPTGMPPAGPLVFPRWRWTRPLFTAAKAGADIDEESPATQIVAVADRRVVDRENLGAIDELWFLVEHVPDAAAEGPDISVVVHGQVVQKIIVGESDIAAVHVAEVRSEAGVTNHGAAEDIAELVDFERILLDRSDVARLPRQAPIVHVKAQAVPELPFRKAELALELLLGPFAVVVDEQGGAFQQPVSPEIDAEIDRPLKQVERAVERQIDVDAARRLVVAVDESLVDELNKRPVGI